MAAIPYLDLSYGTSMTQSPEVNRVQMGDGYSDREKKGLNAQPQRWQLNWDSIPDATAETLRAFFEERGGAGLIEWTPYNQATELKWSNGQFSSEPSGHQTQSCSVILTQEFDL